MTKKVNFKAIVAAVAAGGSYELAIQGAARKIDFVNENYLVTKSLTAGLIGTGMVYFAKPTDEAQRAAGYALIGVGAASGAGKVSSLIVTSGDEPMNGTRARILRNVMTRKRPGVQSAKMRMMQQPSVAAIMKRQRPEMVSMQPTAGGSHWEAILPALSNCY